MGSLLYGLVMLGVGWLVFWSVADHRRPSQLWWPFAMRGTVYPAPQEGWRARRTDTTKPSDTRL